MFNQETILDKEKTNLISVFLQNRPTVKTVEYRSSAPISAIKVHKSEGTRKPQGNTGICYYVISVYPPQFISLIYFVSKNITMMHC